MSSQGMKSISTTIEVSGNGLPFLDFALSEMERQFLLLHDSCELQIVALREKTTTLQSQVASLPVQAIPLMGGPSVNKPEERAFLDGLKLEVVEAIQSFHEIGFSFSVEVGLRHFAYHLKRLREQVHKQKGLGIDESKQAKQLQMLLIYVVYFPCIYALLYI